MARRLLDLDPLQEAAHRALMRHYAALGQSVLALEQYDACRELLQSKLGGSPSPDTEALREALSVNRCVASASPATTIAVQKDVLEQNPII